MQALTLGGRGDDFVAFSVCGAEVRAAPLDLLPARSLGPGSEWSFYV